jgi:LysR family transcriptional regulator, transcriptional activator of the cysJI operon
MVNFRLKVFRAVARHLNFRAAAEELYLTQPAVTQQIKTLEEHLGVQLFDRSGAHITLTPAGALLAKYAGKIERLEDSATTDLAKFAGEQRGELHIGASLTIAQYVLPHILGEFQKQHPQVKPHITTCNTEQVVAALTSHEAALGFVEGPTLRRDIRTEYASVFASLFPHLSALGKPG